MKSNARRIVALPERAGSELTDGTVIEVRGRDLLVELDGAAVSARAVFSCLVAPLAGDRVLCGQDREGNRHVLAIIERPGGQDMTLSFPADASLAADRGALNISSSHSVTVGTAGGLLCYADSAILKSDRTTVDSREVNATGGTLNLAFQTISMVSQFFATMARQAVEKFSEYLRRSEKYDRVSAGQMARNADEMFTLDSKRSILISKKETKIDGERIFMG